MELNWQRLQRNIGIGHGTELTRVAELARVTELAKVTGKVVHWQAAII
jgi:hypothetical protein